jgi:glycerol-3-phosphate dehydrogenase (NAD+)
MPQAKEIHEFLKARDRVDAYPLFKTVYEISWEGREVESLSSTL